MVFAVGALRDSCIVQMGYHMLKSSCRPAVQRDKIEGQLHDLLGVWLSTVLTVRYPRDSLFRHRSWVISQVRIACSCRAHAAWGDSGCLYIGVVVVQMLTRQ
jgi:hypothetical protein